MEKVRDRFWMFGVRPHQDDIWLFNGHHQPDRYFLPWSRITPAEGAAMLGVPNMLMVGCDGEPAPFTVEARGYMESFRNMKQVMWTAHPPVDAPGNDVREAAYTTWLAKRYPNVTGAILDDFFGPYRKMPEGERSDAALARLSEIRRVLDTAPRPLSLYTVYYTIEATLFRPDVFDPIDGVMIWTWEDKDLPKLEENFKLVEAQLPAQKKMLGIYLYDFMARRPVPDDLMEFQCEFGLRMLREGRIEGMIFEANSVMGVGLPSEKWVTDWIARVGDEPLFPEKSGL